MSFGGLNGYVPLNRIWFSGSCVTKFYYMIFIKRFSYVQNFKVHYPVLKRVYFWNGNLQHGVNVSIVWYQNSLYNGHCRDLEFVSSSARLCNRGSLFQSNAPSLLFFFFCSHLFALSSRSERLAGNLFVPGWLLSVLSGSPLSRNVRKARVECNSIMLG